MAQPYRAEGRASPAKVENFATRICSNLIGVSMPLLSKLPFTGKVESLLLRPSRKTGFEKSPTGSIMLRLSGPEGDCHTGLTRASDVRTIQLYKRDTEIRNVRQITILSEEELAATAKDLGIPKIDPAWFGANMVLTGIPDLTLLLPSTRFQFPSGAVLVNDMENLLLLPAIAMSFPIALVTARLSLKILFRAMKVRAQ
jgi:hypothetical protein